jgi:hypothetical protein
VMGLCRVWIAGNPELEAQFINKFSQVQVICPWTITLNRCNGSLQFRVIWKAKNARAEGLHLTLCLHEVGWVDVPIGKPQHML